MHRLVVLYNQPNDKEHFRNYYLTKHIPLAKQLPGLKAMRYGMDLDTIEGNGQYFCIWEGDFENAQAMGEAMQSETGQAVSCDVENYATGGVTILHYEANE